MIQAVRYFSTARSLAGERSNTLTVMLMRQEVVEWLSPPDPSVNYYAARDTHHKGTAVWFIEGNTFRNWKESGSLLWIQGKRTFPRSLRLRYHSSLRMSQRAPAKASLCMSLDKTCFSQGRLYYRLSPVLRLSRISNASRTLGQRTWPISFSILRTPKNRMPVLSSLPSSSSSATSLSLSAMSFSRFCQHTNVAQNSLVIRSLRNVSRRCSSYREKNRSTLS